MRINSLPVSCISPRDCNICNLSDFSARLNDAIFSNLNTLIEISNN